MPDLSSITPTAQSDGADLANRISHFLAARARLDRGHQPPLPSPVRLVRLLTRLHPPIRVQQQMDARSQATVLSLESVEACLMGLRRPLLEAREHGDGIDIWGVASLGRQEVRNASVLAWLIDPRASHGQGGRFLQALFADLGEARPTWANDAVLAQVSVATEERPLGSDRDRVDIALEGPTFVVFIEVKIDAPEGKAQLVRYAEAAGAKARAQRKAHALVLFVSPRPPRDHAKGLLAITWTSIARALEAVASKSRPGLSRRLIVQYAAHVRRFS